MKDENFCCFTGRPVRDPDLKATQSGKQVCEATIAVNDAGKDWQKVYYIDLQMWGNAGINFANIIGKGDLIYVSGKLIQQSWEDKEGKKQSKIRVMVNYFRLCSKKGSGQTGDQSSSFSDEGIPF